MNWKRICSLVAPASNGFRYGDCLCIYCLSYYDFLVVVSQIDFDFETKYWIWLAKSNLFVGLCNSARHYSCP